MHIALADAPEQLDELARLVEAGEEVVLTRDGKAAVRLVPATAKPSDEERRALIRDLQAKVAAILKDQPYKTGAQMQDELYDENGLPA